MDACCTDKRSALEELGVRQASTLQLVLALAVNGVCFALLSRHRTQDINMRSVWVCSRNDLVANTSVLVAAWAVWMLGSPWPDLVAGGFIVLLLTRSARSVAQDANRKMRLAARVPS